MQHTPRSAPRAGRLVLHPHQAVSLIAILISLHQSLKCIGAWSRYSRGGNAGLIYSLKLQEETSEHI